MTRLLQLGRCLSLFLGHVSYVFSDEVSISTAYFQMK